VRVLRFSFHLCILLLTILFFRIGDAASPQPRELNTDRDAFTPSTFTIRPGFALNEMSHVYIQNRDGNPTNNYPEYICRIGANDIFEWRLGVNYSVGSQGNVVTSVEAGELPDGGGALYESNFLYGFKLATSDQNGLIPQSCFIMEATTPMYGEEFGTEPVATIVCGWQLPKKWRIDTAMRYAYAEDAEEWFNRWAPSAVARIPLTNRLEVHAVYFGTFTQGLSNDVNRSFFSPGTHLVIHKNLEIGLRVGWGITPAAANFFSDAGLAVRY